MSSLDSQKIAVDATAAAISSAINSDSASDLQPRHSQQQQPQQQQLQRAQTQTQSQAQTQQQQQNYHQPPSSRVSQQRLAKHKSHVASRLHTRVPSSKGIHANKHHGQSNAISTTAAVRPPNRRTQSDPRLPPQANSSSGPIAGPSNLSNGNTDSATKLTGGLKKISSQTVIAHNRSHTEIAVGGRRHFASKANIAGDRPKRTSSGANISATATTRHRSFKQQARFDVGTGDQDDEDEDEWQDASTSASPYITKPTPKNNQQTGRESQVPPSEAQAANMSAPVSASATTLVQSPETRRDNVNEDMPTSRFIGNRDSALASQGSFYTTQGSSGDGNSIEMTRRIQEAAAAANAAKNNAVLTDEEDAGTISHRRTKPKPAEKSRTQQKLDLQRASSVMDAGALPGAHTNINLMGGGHRLVNVIQPNNYGTATRDPRVLKTLEHTGSEYLVVHRYMNPLARCAHRLSKTSPMMMNLNGANGRGHPQLNAAISMPTSSTEILHAERTATRHSCRISTSSRPRTAKSMHPLANGVFDEPGSTPISNGPVPDDENITVLLQNLWAKTLDLAASQ